MPLHKILFKKIMPKLRKWINCGKDVICDNCEKLVNQTKSPRLL